MIDEMKEESEKQPETVKQEQEEEDISTDAEEKEETEENQDEKDESKKDQVGSVVDDSVDSETTLNETKTAKEEGNLDLIEMKKGFSRGAQLKTGKLIKQKTITTTTCQRLQPATTLNYQSKDAAVKWKQRRHEQDDRDQDCRSRSSPWRPSFFEKTTEKITTAAAASSTTIQKAAKDTTIATLATPEEYAITRREPDQSKKNPITPSKPTDKRNLHNKNIKTAYQSPTYKTALPQTTPRWGAFAVQNVSRRAGADDPLEQLPSSSSFSGNICPTSSATDPNVPQEAKSGTTVDPSSLNDDPEALNATTTQQHSAAAETSHEVLPMARIISQEEIDRRRRRRRRQRRRSSPSTVSTFDGASTSEDPNNGGQPPVVIETAQPISTAEMMRASLYSHFSHLTQDDSRTFGDNDNKSNASHKEQRHRRLLCCLAIVIVIVSAAIIVPLAVIFGRKKKAAEAFTSSSTTTPPPSPPLDSSMSFLYSRVQDITVLDQLQNMDTPQYKAARWLLTTDILYPQLVQDITSVNMMPLVVRDANIDNSRLELAETRILQRFAAAVLYFATGGEEWQIPLPQGQQRTGTSEQQPWLFLNPNVHECQWNGITTSAASGIGGSSFSSTQVGLRCNDRDEITELDLPFLGLQGHLPPEVGFLTNMQQVDLSNNPALIGPLPESMDRMINLSKLFIYSCSLTGTLPHWLNRLRYLDLSSNMLTGSLPSSFANANGNAAMLVDLSNNFLTATLDVFSAGSNSLKASELFLNDNMLSGGLTNAFVRSNAEILVRLDLSNNQFQNGLPSALFTGFSNLEKLDLRRNRFVGRLPSVDSQDDVDSPLQVLLLGENQLSGPLLSDAQLRALGNLRLIDLSINDFTGELALDTFLTGLPRLEMLLLGDNSRLTPGPLAMSNNVTSKSIFLRDLSLRNTMRTGPIPSFLLDQHELLHWLDLSFNDLTGTLPAEFCCAPRLKFLQLNHNNLVGDLEQSCLGTLDARQFELLMIDNNNFTGFADAICKIATFSSVDCAQLTTKSKGSCTRCCVDSNCHPEPLVANGRLDRNDDYNRLSYNFGGDGLVFPFNDTSKVLLPCSPKKDECCADIDCSNQNGNDFTCAGRTCVERGQLRFTLIWEGSSSLNLNVSTPTGVQRSTTGVATRRLYDLYTESITFASGDPLIVTGTYKYSICCDSPLEGITTWSLIVYKNELPIARHASADIGAAREGFDIFVSTDFTLSPSSSPSVSASPSASQYPTAMPTLQLSLGPSSTPSYFPTAPVVPTTLVPTIGAGVSDQDNGILWQQVGDAIVGLHENALAGAFVDITSDGSRIAITGPGNGGIRRLGGYVQVYDLSYNGTSPVWTQVGQTVFNYEDVTHFGSTICISDDGLTIAMGSFPEYESPGLAWVYRFNGTEWVQVGNTLVGDSVGDQFGWGVKITSDGQTLIVNAPQFETVSNNTMGYVRLYRLNEANDTWVQLGNQLVGDNDYDEFGYSFGMSSSGRRLALGATQSQLESQGGYVRAYDFDGRNWRPIGQDLFGSLPGDQFGSYVAMTPNGNIMAVGAFMGDENGLDAGYVRVYELFGEGQNATWIQKGQTVHGRVGDNAGWPCSISQDGSILAVGFHLYDSPEFEDAGAVRIYTFDENNNIWVQSGNDLVGQSEFEKFGKLIALSGDGARVVVGIASFGVFEGQVKVYDATRSSNDN